MVLLKKSKKVICIGVIGQSISLSVTKLKNGVIIFSILLLLQLELISERKKLPQSFSFATL